MARDIRDQRDEGEMAPEPTANHPLQLNLSEEMERTIVRIVREDYDSFKMARDKKNYGTTAKGEKVNFKKFMKSLRDLYNGEREPKTVPWKFCSNRSLRIAASILDMLHARLYTAVVNEELVRWRPGNSDDVHKVERITKLMHWWAWVRCRLRTFYDNWVKTIIGYGDAITETCWDVKYTNQGTTVEEPIVDEMGNPIMNEDGTPATVKSFEPGRFEKSTSKTYLRDQFLLQEGSTDIHSEPVIIEEDILYRVLEQGEAEGKFKNVSSVLRNMIPIQVSPGTNLTPEEEDKIRDIKIRNKPMKIVKEYMHFDANGDGFAEDIRVYVCLEHNLYLGGTVMENITKSGKRPLDYTKFEQKFECPDENIGLGVIEKVKELAEELDAIFNQMSDGNTLSVMNPGFYDPGGDVDAPVLKLAPNKMTPVSDPQRNILFPQINVQSERMLAAARVVMEFIERLTAASSFVMGKQDELAGGSGTATRTQAIMQSAEQRFAIPAERLREGAARILTNHLDVLQLNIPPGLEKRILGEDNEPVFSPNELSAYGISSEMDAYLLTDPSQGSKQTERELSSMFYSMLLQNVIVGTDPAKIYKVTSDFIKAHGKDPKEYLGPEPDFDQLDNPEDENTLIVQGDFARVRAQITENHIHHIRVHEELLNSPSLIELAENLPNLYQQVVTAIQTHIQEHMQMMQVMMQMVNSFGTKDRKGGNNESGEPGQRGSERSDGQGIQGIGGQPGLEQASGPLAQALNAKREGQSGGFA